MQIMNVAYGGSLHQHLPGMEGLLEHGVPLEGTETLHAVTPVPDSFLAATTKSGDLMCSSHHHQGVDRVGDRLRVTGRSPDGLVEALELDVGRTNTPARKPWIVGVQWHPEETASIDPAQQALFDALTLRATERASSERSGAGQGTATED
jgi:putative glutamine amidotransferase